MDYHSHASIELSDDSERSCGLFPEERSSAGVSMEDEVQMDFPMSLLLPRYLLEDILNRLEDAREIAKAQCVCKEFLDGGHTPEGMLKSRDRSVAAASPGRAAVYDAFVFLTALLLSAVFQYLIGPLEKGGTKVHSSGSLEFRWKYISILLFDGWYVWVKFRVVAPDSEQKPSRGIHRKSKIDASGKKFYTGPFEPRFKPPGSHNYISVGSYEVEEDAKIVYQILAYYYGKNDSNVLSLVNGSTYPIPCMTEEEQHLDPVTKKKWARSKAKAILELYNGAVVESMLDWLGNSGIEPSGGILNTMPPPAACGMDTSRIEAEAQPSQLGNQSDDLELVSPSSFNPNVDTVPPAGMQGHVADISTFSDHVVGDANRAEEPDEQPLEPQFQYQSLQEKEADNVIPDYSSILRQVKELERQQQLQQLQIQQQDTRFELHKQLHQLEIQQLQSRISELVGEIEGLRSTEHARKRICTGFYLRNDSQN
ncbi:hypothetical protein M758_9G072100 [Ceratodon purpureus]|nr:hypothetical protein M758_9G072100 [Ceratodon purpureus]